ncbi:SRPBCC domain-containing protein [Microbacterium rhizomatis]|uniref:SRPBCC domain-containing protein n=1 Tax=Microbacterium rhizomatis TaxID=1631477 RepID=A0A5J5J2D0_9MICO|nr:SRPBCC domain-containing protein [Microbacterium rhizomatis]KAA9110220.1 SRPBCC domain-containing protein [Microbacterium rhizomatis]
MTDSARPDGVAHTTRKTFSRTTTVAIDIDAARDKVWRILTAAKDYPAWNSTVVSLAGDIQPGGRLQLVSTLDPTRTFTLKVKEFTPGERLAWGDALGTRVYTVAERPGGKTTVTMTEKIGGPVFPLFASKIPSFDESFSAFAADLKAVAER